MNECGEKHYCKRAFDAFRNEEERFKMKVKKSKLFLDFLKIGTFTYGGGWSIVSQMQKLYVEKRNWLSSEELMDLTSVGRSLPGIMIVNVSMLFGYRLAGYLGGLACVLGIALPPMAILSIITCFYSIFQSSAIVAAAMSGLRAAVVPVIAYAAATMTKSSMKNIPCAFATLISFVAYYFFNLSCICIIIIGIASGFIISEYYERKGRESDGTV